MKLSRPLAILLFVFLPLSLHAQLGLYGSFSATKLNVPNNNNFLYGGTFGGYLASGQLAVLSVGFDFRGSAVGGGGTSFDSGSAGPRVGLNTHLLPVHPYVEGLVGVGHASFTEAPIGNVTKFEYQFLGGFDYAILPRVDWRIAEFSYGGLAGLSSNSFHPKSISTGLVLRLPKVLPLP
jgi:hypothetical protein